MKLKWEDKQVQVTLTWYFNYQIIPLTNHSKMIWEIWSWIFNKITKIQLHKYAEKICKLKLKKYDILADF